jgi:TfoX/Sxy family transcriptional regulator of competence genes
VSLASEELSERIRALVPPQMHPTEKKMFGGRCFMLNGNMLVCPMKDGSMLVRTGKERYAEALERPGTQPMRMGERTMAGFIEVSGDVLEDDDTLRDWIAFAQAFVDTLPAK